MIPSHSSFTNEVNEWAKQMNLHSEVKRYQFQFGITLLPVLIGIQNVCLYLSRNLITFDWMCEPWPIFQLVQDRICSVWRGDCPMGSTTSCKKNILPLKITALDVSFSSRYDSRVRIYEHKMFIRLAIWPCSGKSPFPRILSYLWVFVLPFWRLCNKPNNNLEPNFWIWVSTWKNGKTIL